MLGYVKCDHVSKNGIEYMRWFVNMAKFGKQGVLYNLVYFN